MDYLSLFHWSLISVALLCSIGAHIAKKISIRYPKLRDSILLDGRIIPALLGFIIGLVPDLPRPEAVPYGISSALYFMSAGVFSTWIYSLLERTFRDILPDWIKRKLG